MQLKSSSITYIYIYLCIYTPSRASLPECISRFNALHSQQAIVRRYRLEAFALQKRRVLKRILPKRLFESMGFEWWKLCPFLGVHIALASLVRFVSSSREFCLAWQGTEMFPVSSFKGAGLVFYPRKIRPGWRAYGFLRTGVNHQKSEVISIFVVWKSLLKFGKW